MSNTFTRDPQPIVQYDGDGSRTIFPFTFPVLASDDLVVYVDHAVATGYAITGIGDANGGEIEFNTAPASGTLVTLLRRTEGIRETEFVDGGPFRAAAINAELDRVMLLIQEDREEISRALRGQPVETGTNFCLPTTGARANKLLGFDSAGLPVAYGTAELPTSGDASGAMVTANGATTARALGEHLAARVNVRDFGAIGDGITNDSAAFAAAVAAAQGRAALVYVPASPTAYVLGSTLVLDGVAMLGDGAGSVLKVGMATGVGVQLTGSGPSLLHLRVLGPGASSWPSAPDDVELSGVAVDGVQVASGADDAVLHSVEVAACGTALAIEGRVSAIVGCGFAYGFEGIALRSGAAGAVFVGRTRLHACTTGVRAEADAAFDQLAVRGGAVAACNQGAYFIAQSTGWRSIELADLDLTQNLEVDVRAEPRQSLALCTSHVDDSGKRSLTAVELNAAGETVEAPNLIVENTVAENTRVRIVDLTSGTNLNLLAEGDLIVLASDVDDVDDLWTTLKATRGGVVHRVISQTASTASIQLAAAATLPALAVSDSVRVVGRAGTSTAASVGPSVLTTTFTWLRADDHCRVFAANNPMPADQIELEGPDTELRHFPGLGGEPISVSGVELFQQSVNGALTQLVTLDIAQNAAASFVPQSTIGLIHVFSHGSLGDPAASVLSYRADALGYTQIVAKSTYAVPAVNPAMSDVEVAQLTALTGTTGNPNVFTFSAHTDGKIYVENRLSGPSRQVSLFVIGVPL